MMLLLMKYFLLNRLEDSSIIRLLLEIMGPVSSFGIYRPYRASIVGACYVARTLLYTGLLSVCRPGTCILGRGEDRIYPLGRLPTHPFRVLGFAARGKKRGELFMWRYQGRTSW